MMIRPLEPSDLLAAGELRLHPDVAPFLELTSQSIDKERVALEGTNVIGIFDQDQLRAAITLRALTRPRLQHRGLIELFCCAEDLDAAEKLSAYVVDMADRWLHLSKLDAALDVDAPWRPALINSGFELEATQRDRRWHGGRARDGILLGYLRQGLPQSTPMHFAAHAKQPVRSVKVRPTAAGDAPALRALYCQESIMRGTLQTPLRTVALWKKMLSTPGPIVNVVAELDGEVAGSAVLMREGTNECRTLSLGLAVSMQYQGLGIGSALMRHIIDIAQREYRVHRLELGVFVDNVPAIRMYEQYGFVQEGIYNARQCGAKTVTRTPV